MKILYIHQYFKTPDEGGCIRSYHLAKGLVDSGHEVTVVTAHEGDKEYKIIEGIQIHYSRVPYANHYGFLRRVLAYYRFVRSAIKTIRGLKQKFDLAYVMTTPLTTGKIALFLKEKLNIPYFFEVGDLWPEAPIKMGAIRNGIIKKFLYHFEAKCYFEAQKVIALSPSIRNYIEANSPRTKVHVLPNFADTSFFQPFRKMQQFTHENPFRIGYFGTFGAANHLNYLLSVAASCYEKKLPICFQLMGEGAELKPISKKAALLPNVEVLPFGNTFQVRSILEKQDAVYVSFKNIEILNTGSPNKFFDGLAAGKLIIINFGGWIHDLIERHRCGFYHDPLKPTEFIRKIEVFLKQPQLLQEYQMNARSLGETYYSKSLQVRKLQKIIENEKYLSISDSEVYILTA